MVLLQSQEGSSLQSDYKGLYSVCFEDATAIGSGQLVRPSCPFVPLQEHLGKFAARSLAVFVGKL